MMKNSTTQVREKFSKASETYEEFSLIQKQIANKLFDRLTTLDSVGNVLDIGSGTGYLIGKLTQKYPHLQVYGLDCALGMINMARHKNLDVKFIQADAKDLPFKDEVFSVIISNLSFQWIRDLELAINQARRVLKDKGKFYFTIFLENTLMELRETIFELLKQDFDLDNSNCLGHLPDREFIKTIIKRIGFQDIKMDAKRYRQYYTNLWELLNWLKRIGANRYWDREFYSGLAAKGFIDRVERIYEKQFRDDRRIFATFEVLFVEAIK